nr:MAG TPA: hypothetical protein [Bacteriophage sp.]
MEYISIFVSRNYVLYAKANRCLVNRHAYKCYAQREGGVCVYPRHLTLSYSRSLS